ncbi:hypothetical protein EEP12_19145 [Shigella sonnei]|nr:hypothetical protein [Shigella sonnei]
MSVDFCDARQGGGAYGKTPAARPSSCSWSFAHMFFPVLSPDSVDNSISFLRSRYRSPQSNDRA